MSKQDNPEIQDGSNVGGKKAQHSYSKAFKEKVVRMHEDDGISGALLHKELGVARSAISEWVRRYRESGPEGLKPHPRPGGGKKLPAVVTERIVAIKKENPGFGIRRIGDVLGRWFGLPGSREKVRQVLRDEGFPALPAKPREKNNPQKPRFFESNAPNTLWQSDIMSFRSGGRQVYLIGFMDDYSRYIVGLGLFSTQTTENVLEVYRRATTNYKIPKEILTDNGRQYTNWRGKTRFEKQLSGDKVRHIKSRPHHPQTQGKIERFWKTMLDEYLQKAHFDSFDDAQERIAMWIKYYNHRRPQQGIGGLCPADRYFEIANEVRKVVERQIEENVLEIALKGKPVEPFYMVGRMDGQSVILRAEKGKLKMSVGEDGNNETKEHEFDIGGRNGGASEDKGTQTPEGSPQRGAEGSGSAFGVDGAAQAPRDLPRAGHSVDYIGSMAEACDDSDATGPGTESNCGEGASVEPEASRAAAPPQVGSGGENITPPRTGGKETGNEGVSDAGIVGIEGKETHVGDHAGGSGADDREGWSGGARDLAGGLLHVGEPCACSDVGIARRPSRGETRSGSGSREENAGEGPRRYEGRSGSSDVRTGHQENAGGAAQGREPIAHIWTGR